MGGDAEDVDAAGGVLDDEERVEPVQCDRVEVEQVAGQDRVGLGPQKLRPGGSGPSWRRVDSVGLEDLPHGGGADLVAEACEFAVHASVSPGRVLGCQAHRQRPQPGWDRRAAGPAIAGGPAAGHESPVPAQDRCGRDEQADPTVTGQPADEGGDQCSVGPGHSRSGVPACRCREPCHTH
jgi:hypothetical protein